MHYCSYHERILNNCSDCCIYGTGKIRFPMLIRMGVHYCIVVERASEMYIRPGEVYNRDMR